MFALWSKDFFENSLPLLQYALPLLQERAFCHLLVPYESMRNNIKIQHDYPNMFTNIQSSKASVTLSFIYFDD